MVEVDRLDKTANPNRACKSCGIIPRKSDSDFFVITAQFSDNPALHTTLCSRCILEVKKEINSFKQFAV